MTIAARYQDQDDVMHSGERSYYLALALDARRALNALSAGTDINPAIKALKTAVESLKALGSPNDLYKTLYAEGGYEHFEQIRTLQDVRNFFQDKDLIAELETLIHKTSLDATSIAFARKFFLAIESRALHYYDDPSLMQRSA